LQAASAETPYQRAERQYHELVSAFLESKQPCPGRSAKVVALQAALASTLEGVAPTDGPLALNFAVTANSTTQTLRLSTAGALPIGDNGSVLHAAARFADPPVMELLLRMGLDIVGHEGAGGSALFVAVDSGRRDNVEWLVMRGADVNAVSRSGGSLLRYSMVCRDQALINYLTKAGAKPDVGSREVATKLGIRL
jgi:ankyrin repeat protein